MRLHARDAFAKVNLTLRVLRKRADGYLDIESLVVFVRLADRLEWTQHTNIDGLTLQLVGDFAEDVPAGEENLILRAAGLFARRYGISLSGYINLEKRIPVAAGLGGGSSDAAAMIDALGAGNADEELEALTLDIGADVLACFRSQKKMRACIMRGRGESIHAIDFLPQIPLLLVKPPGALSAGEVYHRWDQLNEKEKGALNDMPTENITLGELVSWCRVRRNDLETAAISLLPEVQSVLDSLKKNRDCLLSRMSGSGPTCFGIYENLDAVEQARTTLARAHPDWWLCATTIR